MQLCQTGPGWVSGGFARVARTVCRLWEGQGVVEPRKCTSMTSFLLRVPLYIVIGPPRPCQHSSICHKLRVWFNGAARRVSAGMERLTKP